MNNDILESDEFYTLMNDYRTGETTTHEVQSFIRQHFTPKTVEEKEHKCIYCGAMTTQPDEECYRNPNLQPPLTKGRKESKIICMGEAFGRARCPVDCQNCIDMDEEHESASLRAQPTTNKDNYRAELLSVATAILIELMKKPLDQYHDAYAVAGSAVTYSKCLIDAIDKEVKSNPASE